VSVMEVAMAFAFITATLKADSQWVALSPGGVRRGALPVGITLPGTIIAFQSGTDVIYANAVRSSVDALYQIKACGTSDQTQAVFDLASRIDDLFKRTLGTVVGGSIFSCIRQSPLSYEDNTAGVQYTHLGGLYRIRTQQIPS
jgi:hypothetical protein